MRGEKLGGRAAFGVRQPGHQPEERGNQRRAPGITLIPSRRAIAGATAILIGLAAAAAPAVQAADAGQDFSAREPPLLAQTQGSERRGERREDREGDRGNRQDTRDECRDAEGAGKDKRDCKQEGREENRGNDEEAPEG